MSFLDGMYDIDAEIGRGVSGCVFQARDNQTSQLVAIKRLDPSIERNNQLPYLSEWDKIIGLSHPSIIQAVNHIEEENERYIITEFAQGESLHQRLLQGQKLSEFECITLFQSLASGLDIAHEKGLLHLNIKPQNVILADSESGRLTGKICDFGLWTIGLEQGPQGGALAFFKAPEQRRGSGMSPASDIYALGKLLYVAVSGEMNGRITPESLPAGSLLQEVIYSCIRTNPEDRYQNMREVQAALAVLEPNASQDNDAPLDAPDGGDGVAYGDAYNVPRSPDENFAAAGGQVFDHSSLSTTGQMRAATEVQSMLLACKNHLNHKRLETCRNVLEDARGLTDRYADTQTEQWLESTDDVVAEIEKELHRKENELSELLRSAQEAYDDGRYEDVQMAAITAKEISIEQTGLGGLEHDATQTLTNIGAYWEDALRSMNANDLHRADIDCIKILELNPKHSDALKLRNKISGLRRRRKVRNFLMKVTPLILLIAAAGGAYVYFQLQYTQQTSSFSESIESNRGDSADNLALLLKNRHRVLVWFFEEYKPASAYLSKRAAARDAMSELREAQGLTNIDDVKDDTVKLTLNQASELSSEAQLAFETVGAANYPENCIELAAQATDLYRSAFTNHCRILAKAKASEEQWQEAHDLLQSALEVQEDEEARKMLAQVMTYLVPELIVSSTVDGKRADGATTIINGERKGLTPARILLEINVDYEVIVILPPRNNVYYKPHIEKVRFDKRMAKTLVVPLEVTPGPVVGAEWVIDSVKLKLKSIAAGSFRMGSENGSLRERPVHTVIFPDPIWMSDHEITRAQYKQVISGQPGTEDDARFPMANITWSEAVEFCKALTKMEFKQNRIPVGYAYRLPTEAEWEFACRAGRTGPVVDIDEVAWHLSNAGGKIKEIGTKAPNPWGLFDMQGNVSEWCLDRYNNAAYSGRNTVTSPLGPSRGTLRVIRGGSAKVAPVNCRAFVRSKASPKSRLPDIGFRVVLAPTESSLKAKK